MALDTLSNLIFTGPLSWTVDAACEGRTELFFAPAGERPEARVWRENKARAVCMECPVLQPCSDWAREQREYGFWGGESEEERAAAGFRVDMPVGRVARYPALGWETGDWGGAELLGREALFLAARAEDGRGTPTALVAAIRSHFGAASVEAVGIDVHYRRLREQRLGELAPLVVASADAGDEAAIGLIERLANEIVLLVRRALRDLELSEADVVLGGGMFQGPPGRLLERVADLLPAGVHTVVLEEPPVLGAALAALDLAGAGEDAYARLRRELRER